MADIDIDLMITLIQQRPFLWDKTQEDYKNKEVKESAWREISEQLVEGFQEMVASERNYYATQIKKKWANIRDSFQRGEKKKQQPTELKSGNRKSRPYYYDRQLQFLKKTVVSHSEDDSFSGHGELAEVCVSDVYNGEASSRPSASEMGVAVHEIKKPRQQKNQKRKPDPVEVELKNVIKLNDRHSSFFSGIIPSLETFDDDEVVEFQLSVLQTVSDIKKRKKTGQITIENIYSRPVPVPQKRKKKPKASDTK